MDWGKKKLSMETPKSKRAAPQGPFLCYALTNAQWTRSYTGQTNCFQRRIRQHNKELAGGARYTSAKDQSWTPIFKVHGFSTLRSVLQFEWAMKKRKGPRSRSGPAGRIRQLEHILSFGTRYANARENWVECHVSQEVYLKHAALDAAEFARRRRAQGIRFKFSAL
jgi:predicted GIY-YIG superfamily endonuclease